jgi:3-oxoacyl-[acyl-carrier-protein] synthase II
MPPTLEGRGVQLAEIEAVVVAYDLVSPYGWDVASCWEGLFSGATAIRKLDRFSTESLRTDKAALVPGLDPDADETLVMQMVRPLLERSASTLPGDALLLLATTNGEIDVLERSVLLGTPDADGSRPDRLAGKIQTLCRLGEPGVVVCAACASSSAAVAQGAAMIRDGDRDCVLVVASDNVSEFVAAGFSSLMALDRDMARPFDKNRRGMSLGEAAAFTLLMSDVRASREGRPVHAEIAGWGLSSDANHITGPSRDGSGLALALRKALRSAALPAEEVGSISAHGTGTEYNDSMEMKAFRSVFTGRTLPTYSLKGGIGHTMGTAGLVDIIVAIETLREKAVPPTVNLRDASDEARGWASPEPRACESAVTVSTNSGFGGVNCAVVLRSGQAGHARMPSR